MSRSPIEMMIDRACGYDPTNDPKRDFVTLRCPMCKRTKKVDRDKLDPPNTTTVEVPCDRCDRGGLKAEINYFNAAGQHIDFETGQPKELG